MNFRDVFLQMNKNSAAMLTPQAQQAAIQPPADPAMAGGMPAGGAPMDPAMMGGAAMDPSMMTGGMPAGGAPMDPAMMGGAPAAQGMPSPVGAPGQSGVSGAWMQDQMFIDFLLQSGFQIDQQGNVIDPNGQPMDPQIMDQLYAEFQNQMAQMGGAAMDPNAAAANPAMTGGMPPAGAEPAAQSPGTEMVPPGIPQETLNQLAGITQDVIDTALQEKLSSLDKKITAFAEKLDTIKTMLDDIIIGNKSQEDIQKSEDAKLDSELQAELRNAQPAVVEQPVATAGLVPEMAPEDNRGSLLSLMRGA